MTSKQLVILNSLVTFAAENVPGGLSPEEREVARIVGAAALLSGFEVPEDVAEQPTEVLRKVDQVRYRAIFSGKDKDGKTLVVYKGIRDSSPFYIRYDGGGLWALAPGSEVHRWTNLDGKHHIRIDSPEWRGEASGSHMELIEESDLR